MKILLLGGTGHLGHDLMSAAQESGHQVRIASRRARPAYLLPAIEWAEVDLAADRGIEASVAGIDAIIHAAGDPKDHAAVEVEGTRRLLSAARAAGVGHLIYVSIVGIDRIPFPYYRTKLAAEHVIAEDGLPYSILRATQFHYFVEHLLSSLARIPFIVPLPAGFQVQPVATEDVAARLMRALAEGPRGLLRDFCGPEVLPLADAAAQWKAARGIRKPLLSFPAPGKTAAAFRAGYNTNPDGELGTKCWEEWLQRQGAPSNASSSARQIA